MFWSIITQSVALIFAIIVVGQIIDWAISKVGSGNGTDLEK